VERAEIVIASEARRSRAGRRRAGAWARHPWIPALRSRWRRWGLAPSPPRADHTGI